MKLYTNSNETRLEKRLKSLCKNTDIYISVAFFTNYEFIEYSVLNGCNINLIIRLSVGTDPDSLLKIYDNKKIIDNVNIRYYACDEFHPKFYIIDNISAIIGSSNLTQKGLSHNKEVNIEIEPENPLYDDLKNEFDFEWEYANVLTREKVLELKNYCEENKLHIKNYHGLYSKIGENKPPNIINDNIKDISLENIENFRKKYQLYIASFNRLKKMYTSASSDRKYVEELPLRIEIDRFLSWIKDKKYIGEEYPVIYKSWDSRWDDLSEFFKYPPEIRRAIYTTNAVESLNYQLRKVTKNRSSFSTDDAILKLLYLALRNASKKWTMPVREWRQALNQFAVEFGKERVPFL
jgi:HKD family nuclease